MKIGMSSLKGSFDKKLPTTT